MKRLLLQLLVVSVVVIAAFWPLAGESQGPWLATHVVIPVGIAVVAVMVFRVLRSLIVAVLCALAAAGVIVLLMRSYGEQMRALFERWIP
jgi:hypothetical protein